MPAITCYDNVFTVKINNSVKLRDWLAKRGLTLEELPDASEMFRFEEVGPGDFVTLFLGNRPLVNQQPFELAAEVMLSKIHWEVALKNTDLTFLKADSLRLKDGTGLMLAGPAFCGKSYLARALETSETLSWSTHYTALNSMGELLGYPSSRRPGAALKVSTLAVLSYRPDGQWCVDDLSPGKMALQLTPLIVGEQESLVSGLPRLAKLCAEARRRVVGVRGEAQVAAELILA